MRLGKRQWYNAETRSSLPRGRTAVEIRSPSPLTAAQSRRTLAASRTACMSLVSADEGQAEDGPHPPFGQKGVSRR